MKEQKRNWIGNLSLILGLLVLCGILIITVVSMKTTGQCYTSLKDADLTQGIESTLYYYDHMLAQIGFGISIIPNEIGNEARLSSFLSSSIRAIDMRIIVCGLVYSMMVSVVLQYFLYSRYHNKRKKYSLGIVITSIASFAAFLITVLVSKRVFGIPYIFPNGHEWLFIIVGLLSVIAGNCALSAILSVVRHKKLAAVLAVPVVLCLFIVSMNLETHIYMSPTVESFDYLYETHADALEEDYDGEAYYDEEKNVLVLDGEEYPPETIDNPEYYTGWKRTGTFLFELADAYSGNGLLLTEAIIESLTPNDGFTMPFWVAMAYILKAGMWIAISFWLIKRRSIRNSVK